MPRCPTLPAATDPDHVLLAPAPNESGIYPIGVFSDVETTLTHDEVEDVLREFSEAAARIRGRYMRR